MKIAIAGAGAMGSRIGLMLHQSGNEVLLMIVGLLTLKPFVQMG